MTSNDTEIVAVPTAHPAYPPSEFPIIKIPSKTDRDYAKKRVAAQEDFLQKSKLISAGKSGDSAAALGVIVQDMSRAVELLDFRRMELEGLGADTTSIILKRSELLKQLASVLADIRKMRVDRIDVRSPQMVLIFKHFVNTVVDVAAEVLPSEYNDIFIQKMTSALQGWEDTVEATLESSSLR